jgi:hypothetical protein
VLRSTALALAVLCAAAPASANKSSNPAFLGIGMNDMSGGGGVRGVGPCTIMSIEAGSGAEAAMLQPGDVLERVDTRPIPDCAALIALITSKAPGTVIQVEVRRRAQPLKVKAELLTRDEILRRRLVGQPVPAAEMLRVEDGALVELGALKRTTIVGWFPTSCADCDALFGAVARWGRERAARRAPVGVIAAVADVSLRRSATENLEQLRLVQRSLDVPLLAADFETYSKFAMRDGDRIHFMVIDGRGVVQYVTPIVPDSEDTAALLDELYAAAEQTARRSTR